MQKKILKNLVLEICAGSTNLVTWNCTMPVQIICMENILILIAIHVIDLNASIETEISL
jgi:hypothetical protein